MQDQASLIKGIGGLYAALHTAMDGIDDSLEGKHDREPPGGTQQPDDDETSIAMKRLMEDFRNAPLPDDSDTEDEASGGGTGDTTSTDEPTELELVDFNLASRQHFRALLHDADESNEHHTQKLFRVANGAAPVTVSAPVAAAEVQVATKFVLQPLLCVGPRESEPEEDTFTLARNVVVRRRGRGRPSGGKKIGAMKVSDQLFFVELSRQLLNERYLSSGRRATSGAGYDSFAAKGKEASEMSPGGNGTREGAV
jgi:hypothetical protein